MAFGLVLLARLQSDNATLTQLIIRNVICGLGFGLFQPPNNRELLGNAPRELAGIASGVLATVRVLGQTFGAAGAAFALQTAVLHTTGTTPEYTQGIQVAFGFAASITLLAMLVSATRLHVSHLDSAKKQ